MTFPEIPGAPPGLVEEVWSDCYRAIPHFKGGLVVDIGAGVGVFSSFALAHGCRVRAVEPHRESAGLLRSWDVEIIEAAAGDGSWLGVREEGHGVQTFPGDSIGSLTLAEILGDDRADVLKVDCEGCEYPLLVGADLSMVDYLAVEVHLWSPVENDQGLGIRPEPAGDPSELIEWVARTHHVELSSPAVMWAGGYLFGTLRG